MRGSLALSVVANEGYPRRSKKGVDPNVEEVDIDGAEDNVEDDMVDVEEQTLEQDCVN